VPLPDCRLPYLLHATSLSSLHAWIDGDPHAPTTSKGLPTHVIMVSSSSLAGLCPPRRAFVALSSSLPIVVAFLPPHGLRSSETQCLTHYPFFVFSHPLSPRRLI
jgi:hypothetical protein